MFQFTGFPLYDYVFTIQYMHFHTCGFPHSDIHGSKDICSSPWLFAAYHVFHRLLVPRHPPCALISLTFSQLHSVVTDGLLFLFSYCSILMLPSDVFSIFFGLISVFGFQGTTFVSADICISSGDGEIRTLDPLLARQVLSQLSYAPILNLAATCAPTPLPVQYHRPLKS